MLEDPKRIPKPSLLRSTRTLNLIFFCGMRPNNSSTENAQISHIRIGALNVMTDFISTNGEAWNKKWHIYYVITNKKVFPSIQIPDMPMIRFNLGYLIQSSREWHMMAGFFRD